MSFRKGDKVEVMYQKEIPVSWCVGEILSGNDHTYRVKLDYYPGMCNNKMVKTVSRKFIRPCPILVQGEESCMPGDIVEVFHYFSWKLASIFKVLKDNKEINGQKEHVKNSIRKNHYVVRLLGCLQELLVDKSIIRTRQIWLDGKWILIGRKNSQRVEDVLATGKTSISNNYRISSLNAWVNTKDCSGESPMMSCRSLKRSSLEARKGGVKKSRAVQKYGRIHRVTSTTPSHKKVLLGNFFNTASYGFNRTKQSGVPESSQPHLSDNDECSVGSCSVTDQSPNNQYNAVPCHLEGDTLSSDAESCNGYRNYDYLRPNEEEVEFGIRRLELHAYRSTLEALYASGPLSWEQEAMLTNLRILLRISNDEHSMELKYLTKSADTIR